jgi:hypothetical protein
LYVTSVKKLSSYRRIKRALNNFIGVFGDRIVGTLKPVEIEDYQDKREKHGLSYATIDMEISIAKTMVNKAFDNDLISGRSIKAFRAIKRKVKCGSNARKRIICIKEYLSLIDVAPPILK